MKSLILTVSPQGQISIPKEWREELQIKKGAKLIAWIEDKLKTKTLHLTPKPKRWTDVLMGSGKELWGDSEEYIRKERKQWE